MATVEEKITELQGVKNDIKQALINAGVDMTGVPFTGYAGKIAEGGKTYLYKDGDQCTNITGGWTITPPEGAASGYETSFNKNGCLYCGGQNSSTAYFITTNSINLSEYNRLVIEFYHESTATDANTQFGVTNNNVSVIKMALAQSFKSRVCYMGTSNLANDKLQLWLWTGGYSITHLYIKRIWLE